MDFNRRLFITVIRLIGCGNMGSAMIEGLKRETVCYDVHPERAEALAKKVGGRAVQTPLEESSADEILLIAVKPKDFQEADYKGFNGKLLISIMTGITRERLEKSFSSPILLAMPNLAVRYGMGIVALAENPVLDKSYVEEVLTPLGHLEWFHEKHFPAITALTGSGPAFVLQVLRSIEAAGLKMGLPPERVAPLARELITSSLKWLEATGEPSEALIKKIASKGGTTEAGLKTFESLDVGKGLTQTFISTFDHFFK